MSSSTFICIFCCFTWKIQLPIHSFIHSSIHESCLHLLLFIFCCCFTWKIRNPDRIRSLWGIQAFSTAEQETAERRCSGGSARACRCSSSGSWHVAQIIGYPPPCPPTLGHGLSYTLMALGTAWIILLLGFGVLLRIIFSMESHVFGFIFAGRVIRSNGLPVRGDWVLEDEADREAIRTRRSTWRAGYWWLIWGGDATPNYLPKIQRG